MNKLLTDIHEYELNDRLRTITTTQFENLKQDLIKNGQREPLLVTPDGEVIGGNHRLKAMRELGWVSAICETIEFGQDPDGWYVIRNNEANITRHYESIEQAKFLTSLLDNDPSYATYNKEALLSYADTYHVDYHEIRLAEPAISLAQLEHIVAPEPQVDLEEKKVFTVTVSCENEIEQGETYDKLTELGYKCKRT